MRLTRLKYCTHTCVCVCIYSYIYIIYIYMPDSLIRPAGFTFDRFAPSLHTIDRIISNKLVPRQVCFADYVTSNEVKSVRMHCYSACNRCHRQIADEKPRIPGVCRVHVGLPCVSLNRGRNIVLYLLSFAWNFEEIVPSIPVIDRKKMEENKIWRLLERMLIHSDGGLVGCRWR